MPLKRQGVRHCGAAIPKENPEREQPVKRTGKTSSMSAVDKDPNYRLQISSYHYLGLVASCASAISTDETLMVSPSWVPCTFTLCPACSTTLSWGSNT